VGYLHDFSQAGKTEQKTYAADLEARYEFLRLQAEYYRRHDLLQGVRLDGYQVSLFGNFLDDGPLPFGVATRFDAVHSQTDDGMEGGTENGSVAAHLRRLTLACFIRPFDVTVLKLEYLHYFEGTEALHGSSVFAQLVIGFK
jgi:hypothetical protein